MWGVVLDRLSWGSCYLAGRRRQQRGPATLSQTTWAASGSGQGYLSLPEKGFPDPVNALRRVKAGGG